MSISWDDITTLQATAADALQAISGARDRREHDTLSAVWRKAQFNLEYALALHMGQRRFGSACTHDKQVNGRCVYCLRRVV